MSNQSLSKEALSQQVNQLLGTSNSVVVEASKLTSFPWKSLCFERHDNLVIKVDTDDSSSSISLPYEEFFVDEGHVPYSLEDTCLTPNDRILIKRKYPGYTGPIEFQKAPASES